MLGCIPYGHAPIFFSIYTGVAANALTPAYLKIDPYGVFKI